MQAYQTILPDLRALDATLVAISPMLPDGSLSMAEKNALEYEVLSDVGNRAAGDYGLVWRFPPALQEVYRTTFEILLPQVNGDESWELPLTGTFVVDEDGVVRYAFVDPDYTRRAEPTEILAALRSASAAGWPPARADD